MAKRTIMRKGRFPKKKASVVVIAKSRAQRARSAKKYRRKHMPLMSSKVTYQKHKLTDVVTIAGKNTGNTSPECTLISFARFGFNMSMNGPVGPLAAQNVTYTFACNTTGAEFSASTREIKAALEGSQQFKVDGLRIQWFPLL